MPQGVQNENINTCLNPQSQGLKVRSNKVAFLAQYLVHSRGSWPYFFFINAKFT